MAFWQKTTSKTNKPSESHDVNKTSKDSPEKKKKARIQKLPNDLQVNKFQ